MFELTHGLYLDVIVCVSYCQAGNVTAAPLVGAKDEQRFVIHFYRQKVCKVLKFTCICLHSLGTVLFLGKVCTIRKVFKKSQTNVTDEECSGCPSVWTSNKDI
jgi:hypothetical protein